MSIDGCHLEGLYKGILLSVVVLDTNNGIYLIAACVRSVESTNIWT